MKAPDAFADNEGVISSEFGLLRQVGVPNSIVLLHRAQHRTSALTESVARHHKGTYVKSQCALKIYF